MIPSIYINSGWEREGCGNHLFAVRKYNNILRINVTSLDDKHTIHAQTVFICLLLTKDWLIDCCGSQCIRNSISKWKSDKQMNTHKCCISPFFMIKQMPCTIFLALGKQFVFVCLFINASHCRKIMIQI